MSNLHLLPLCLAFCSMACVSASIDATPLQVPRVPATRILAVVARGELRSAYARELGEALVEQLGDRGIPAVAQLQDRLSLDDPDLLRAIDDFGPDGVLVVLPLPVEPMGRDATRISCAAGFYVPGPDGARTPLTMTRVWKATAENHGGVLDGQIDGRMAQTAGHILRELWRGGYLTASSSP